MNKEAIKATMQTKGWEEIEAMLNNEIVNNNKDIEIDKLDDRTIAVQTIGNIVAGRMVKKVLDKLDTIKNAKTINSNKSYK
tara:strand:+ start:2788 stop:3030 length:243 start_codon:yes stop_codon:yes gene_type:complete